MANIYDRFSFPFLFTEGGICSCIGSVPPVEHITPDDEDVLEEENIVKQQTREGIVDPNVAVQIRGLVKTYPGSRVIGCCKCKKTSPYHAIKVKISFQLQFLSKVDKVERRHYPCYMAPVEEILLKDYQNICSMLLLFVFYQ